MSEKQAKTTDSRESNTEAMSPLVLKFEIWIVHELQQLETEYGHFVSARSNREYFKSTR